jgi:CheY-like chemotaxis protein
MPHTTTAPTIVIADDEPLILQAYQEGLQRAGFTIVAAADGEAALQAIKEHPPSLVLLDLIMPKLNGFEVLKQLQNDGSLNHIPVIVISNLSQTTDEEQVRKLGAVAFIVKSDYSLKELVGIVRQTIAGAAPA